VALDSLAFATAKGFVQFEMKDNGLGKALKNGNKVLQDAVDAKMQFWAPQCEAYMKANAPWTDRTGNARNGLGAQAYRADPEHGIVLFHSVPYGIWLEVKYSGEYAIIDPTLQYMGPLVMQSLQNMLSQTRFT